MILITILVVSGSSWVLARYIGPFIALGVLAGLVWWGVMAVNDYIGISAAIVGSWKWLSGVDSARLIAQTCSPSIVFRILIPLILALCNFALGLLAIFGTPIGAGATIVGAIRALVSRNKDLLAWGLRTLTYGLGAVVAAGLTMRLINIVTGIGC